MAWMGWVNKLAGILVYALLYALILSVLFFYAAQMNLITAEAIAASRTYPIIQPFGPKVIEMIGILIPLFSNMFTELEAFFEKLGGGLQPQ
jgi:membrane protein required for colicin V production